MNSDFQNHPKDDRRSTDSMDSDKSAASEEIEMKIKNLEKRLEGELSIMEKLDNQEDLLRSEIRNLKFEWKKIMASSLTVVSSNSTPNEKSMATEFLSKGIGLQEALEKEKLGVSKFPNSEIDADDLVFDYHKLSIETLLQTFQTSSTEGLSLEEAKKRLHEYGPNVVQPKKPNPIWKVLQWFFGGFGLLLFGAGIAALLAWQPFCPSCTANLGIFGICMFVVLINGFFNAFQEWSSSKVMGSIAKMLPSSAVAIRNGQSTEIKLSELVPGDIVEVGGGDKVPADLRLIQCDSLKVDQSLISGESEPVRCSVDCTSDIYLESKNILPMGGLCIEGEGVGVVVATGNNSVVGKIAQMATAGSKTPTAPASRDLNRFVIVVTCIAVSTAVLITVIWGAWVNISYPNFISTSTAISNFFGFIVAYVPEGLPVCVALTLTLVARRMAQQKVLVRNLPTVETLGCVSVIASDKTGTLTQNKMTVVRVFCNFKKISEANNFHHLWAKDDPVFSTLLKCSVICNRAIFQNEEQQKTTNQPIVQTPLSEAPVIGDATDTAMLRWGQSITNVDSIRDPVKKYGEVPFNSKNKWHMVIVNVENDYKHARLILKGAAEIILSHCKRVLTDKGERELTESDKKKILKNQEQYAKMGERVLAVAHTTFESKKFRGTFEDLNEATQKNLPMDDLCFLGLISIMDVPRPESKETIEQCHKAGIKVMMVTGDHPLTAEAIAKLVGIIRPESEICYSSSFNKETSFIVHGKEAIVVNGPDLAKFDETMWDWVLSHDQVVFARTQPEQKLRIVKECQRLKMVVAVTGDGVNDAPALKQADVGVAMGSGSDVAREAASMILMDSNLSSILVGIENGRRVFENLKKVCLYLLPGGTWAEMLTIVVNILLGTPAPLGAFLMIFISCVTDIAPALSLVFEEPERDLMSRPPRNVEKQKIVNWKLIPLQAYFFLGNLNTIACFINWFYYWKMYTGLGFGDLLLQYDYFGSDAQLADLISRFPENFGPDLASAKDQLIQFTNTASSVYFVSIVYLQMFANLMSTRTRRLSIFQHNPFWGKTKNWAIFIAMAISTAFVLILLYIPVWSSVFGTAPVPVEIYFTSIAMGIFVMILDEIRRLVARTFPNSIIAKISW